MVAEAPTIINSSILVDCPVHKFTLAVIKTDRHICKIH